MKNNLLLIGAMTACVLFAAWANVPDGRYLRVVLRPGPGEAFTCVSAYPVTQSVWLSAKRAKSARFPP